MAKIVGISGSALLQGPGSPGITRHLAFKGEGLLVVRAHGEPGTISGWHHHGEYEVYGYMISGSARLESGPGGVDFTSVGPGDFFYVPPQYIHRDVNPSQTQGQEVILFLRGRGPMVVNVDAPDPYQGNRAICFGKDRQQRRCQ